MSVTQALKIPRKILVVVADEGDEYYLRSQIVTVFDHEYIRVGSCAEAKDKMKSERPDLVLLNLTSADKEDFLGLAQSMRNLTELKDIPILATGSEDNKQKAMMLCDDFIIKPYRVENMRKVLEKMMSK